LLNAAALVGGHALAPTSDEPQFIGEGEVVLDESGQMYFKTLLGHDGHAALEYGKRRRASYQCGPPAAASRHSLPTA
jgi:hypothetical protein